MIMLYEGLDKINQTVVGGTCALISVGGHITGGGHSVISTKYGLAADQVCELPQRFILPMQPINLKICLGPGDGGRYTRG